MEGKEVFVEEMGEWKTILIMLINSKLYLSMYLENVASLPIYLPYNKYYRLWNILL